MESEWLQKQLELREQYERDLKRKRLLGKSYQMTVPTFKSSTDFVMMEVRDSLKLLIKTLGG